MVLVDLTINSVFNLSIQEAYSSLDSKLVDAAISIEIDNVLKYKCGNLLKFLKLTLL